jgi:hypothetical protein
MEYLLRRQDESDRGYQNLLDLTNAAWPDPPGTVDAVRGLGRSVGVLRVRRIRIVLKTRPAR